MSENMRNFTGRAIDDIPLTEYLAGTSSTATFKTSVSGQAAVIKLFALDSAKADAQLAHLQLTEKLAHPHLLRTIKTGRAELDGTPFVYVVAEFADENLAQVLPERALTAPETREVLQSTLHALSYLHSQGFVHADLKPANIMAVGDQLKLSVDGVQGVGEALNRALGPHDAPESAQKLSPASDVWSLGVTLVEVLTQQLPPKPVSDATGPAVPESVPGPFREIAQHSLLRTPELRWSIAEISARLNPKAPATSPAPARPVAPPLSPASRPVPRPTSKRPFILLAIVAAIVIAIVLIPRLSEHKSAPPIPAPVESQSAPQAPSEQPAPAPEMNTEPVTSETTSPAPTPAETNTAVAENEDRAGTSVKHITDEPAEEKVADADTPAETTSAPGVVRQVMPKIIPQAQKSIHGKIRVKVKVNVDASGNVVDSSFISRGPSSYFARVTEDAARRWKFVPSSTQARVWNLEFDFKRNGTQVRSAEAR
jgi:outer membrane biosynthesis protein TonB